MTTRTPLIGQSRRYFFSIFRKVDHSVASGAASSWNVNRPAVSRMTASLANHQSQLRVPPGAGEPVAADGELEPRVLQRRRLARLRLADEEVPGERVDLQARPLELGERLGPLLRQLLDGLADLLLGGAGAALGVAGEVLLEGAAPRLVALLDEGVEGGDEEGDDDEAADDGPPVLPEAERPRDDEADRHEEEDDARGS